MRLHSYEVLSIRFRFQNDSKYHHFFFWEANAGRISENPTKIYYVKLDVFFSKVCWSTGGRNRVEKACSSVSFRSAVILCKKRKTNSESHGKRMRARLTTARSLKDCKSGQCSCGKHKSSSGFPATGRTFRSRREKSAEVGRAPPQRLSDRHPHRDWEPRNGGSQGGSVLGLQ